MTKPLPKNKFLTGIFEPWSAESTINDLIIVGEIPQELNATFYGFERMILTHYTYPKLHISSVF